MSIADEIIRLNESKQDIKDAVEKRGVAVDESATIDRYASFVENAPYAVKGKFTPEEDTYVFSVSGVNFTPVTVVSCCTEFENNVVPGSVEALSLYRGGYSSLRFRDDIGTRMYASISIDSSAVVWTDNGVEFTVSQNTGPKLFKAGYTYEYIVSGGFSK